MEKLNKTFTALEVLTSANMNKITAKIDEIIISVDLNITLVDARLHTINEGV